MKKETKKSLLKLFCSLVVIGAVILVAYLLLKHFGITDISREQLQDYISSKGALGPLVFILATFLQVTIIPIPSTVTILGGNYLFGPFLSFIYSYIGLLLGSLFAFFLGKKLGRPYLNWIAGDSKKVDLWLDRMKGKEKVFLFFAFLFPAFPDDLLCSVAGITTLSYGGFMLMQFFTRATSIGATLLFVSGEVIPYEGWGLWVIGILIFLGILCFALCLIFSDKLYKLFDKMTSKIKSVLGVKNMESKSYDIIVVGGGLSGTAAAISASREGKSVLLIEKYNCLGGAASYDLVLPFMYNGTTIDGKYEELSKGLFKEIKDRLSEAGAVREEYEDCFNEEYLKLILNKMALESGVKLLFQSNVCDVSAFNGKIRHITVSSVDGLRRYTAKCYIDATGDATLAFLAGFKYQLGRSKDDMCQPMTLSFRVSGIDEDDFFKELPLINEEYKRQKELGVITNPRENLLVFKTTHKGILHFNTTRVVKHNPTNIESLTDAEIIAREQVFEIVNLLKGFESCKNMTLLATGMQIGVRESRKVIGNHILTGDEIRALTKFDDSIACCCYDIDIHSPDGEGTSHYYFPHGEYYTIPYGSLVPKGSKNLLVCGRCISCDQEAQASLRIMPVCITLGQAAGIAGAICCEDKKSPDKIDICKLQAKLLENGAKIK
ncbi:MAG: FAD-dependent oxidoreductase [Clostridia bacterium]|nr:FAD-dependent oxidoreductase [Clostridia bacterium]